MMRPTIIYVASMAMDPSWSRLLGCKVTEIKCTTTAPLGTSNRGIGAWRTEELRTDEELREWVEEWWQGSLDVFDVFRDAQKEGPGVVAPEPTSPRKGSGPIEGPSPTRPT